MRRVLVVGAGLAGLRTAEALRRQGFDGELTLLGDEPHPPYDRPPLSKEVLRGERDPASLRFRDPDAIAALGLTLDLGRRAVRLDPVDRWVGLDDGRRLRYDGLVLATGSHPVRLALPGATLPGVRTLRTVDDALALRAALAAGPRVVVIGGGFIGSEVAAAVRARGLSVTVVETLAAPLVRVLGPRLGDLIARLHLDAGVDLRCGRSATAFEGADRVEAVRLDDGSRVPADLVLVSVGARPAVGWLAGSGLRLDDGVRCDARLACGPPGMVAAGDVASWPHPRYGPIRVEHWTNAAEQAVVAARALLNPTGGPGYAGVPYVWSDVHGVRLQILGLPGRGEPMIRHGSLAEGRLVALSRQDDTLCGAIALNWPRALMRYRTLVANGASWADAMAVEPPDR